MDSLKKKCPLCAEFVQPEAKICRFCQHKFEEEKPRTEAEQLAAWGEPAGPACPKCSGISTYSEMEEIKATHWWIAASALFLHCRNCGERWRPYDTVPVENFGMGLKVMLVFLGMFAFVGLILFFALAPRGPVNSVVSATSAYEKVKNDADLLVYRCGNPDKIIPPHTTILVPHFRPDVNTTKRT